jgi:hypothetical protein
VLIPKCPLCGGPERYYSFLLDDRRFDQCKDCGLLMRTATPAGTAAQAKEDDHSVAGLRESVESGAGSAFFTLLARYVPGGDLRLGVVGKGTASLLAEAERRGFRVSALADGEPPARAHDVVLAVNMIEESATPVEYLESLRAHLVAGGTLALITRQLVKPRGQAQSGRVLDQRQSLTDTNLQTVLWKAGFADAYLSHHVAADDGMRREPWFNEQTIALGRMHVRRALPRLSIIVPVYNEAATAAQVLDGLAAREIPGIELEIVVVESGSNDGSREIVGTYQNDPRFKIILEDRPRGKGSAVRNGFNHATGDVFLIQDADLEYDLLDYEMLIDPILRGRTAFVLGTRHAGDWKIRKFAQNHLANVMNVAHWGFAFALNQLYEQAMTDPFTMFKVFRADCLSGLEFECERFDFDVELVCKLLRKGYTPLEIPVNYQSRSFEEGKKVRIFRDPITWLRAMLKYREATPRQLGGTSNVVRALEQGADQDHRVGPSERVEGTPVRAQESPSLIRDALPRS